MSTDDRLDDIEDRLDDIQKVKNRIAYENLMYDQGQRQCDGDWDYKLGKCVDKKHNTPPTANAGNDQEVIINMQVQMVGTATDAENNIKLLKWEQVKGKAVDLIVSADGSTARFTPTVEDNYVFVFSAIDQLGLIGSDDIEIKVKKPSGKDFKVDAGEDVNISSTTFPIEVQLNGKITGNVSIYDYTWTGLNGIERSLNPKVIIPSEGDYSITFTAKTVNGDIKSDSLVIKAKKEEVPKTIDAKAELLIFANDGDTITLNGSDSTGPIVRYEWLKENDEARTITLTPHSTIKYSDTFKVPTGSEGKRFDFRLRVFDAQGRFDDDVGGTKVQVRPQTGGGEEVLWDSNIHLKVTEQTRVTNTFGSQDIDGKGVFMAASGSPRLIIQPNGEFDLEAGSGHGRVYIQCKNYNARLEGEVKIDDSFSVVRNTTWRLRSRHNEGGSCENRFGGFGATHEMEEQLAEYSTESCHNNHENTTKKPLAKKVQRGQWIKFKFSVCDNLQKSQVLFKTEYDYGDGQGFVTVLSGKHSSPKDYYMRESDFLVKRSYAWLRMNNEATGRVRYRNVKIVKIAAGSLGTGAGLMAGKDTEIDTGITPSKEDLERAKIQKSKD